MKTMMKKLRRAAALCLLLMTVFAVTVSAGETPYKNGTYQVSVDLEGGSGRADVASPAEVTVKDGRVTAVISWSSSHYDYMIVDGEKYLPVNEDGNSVFEIPVAAFDEPLAVIADTTAMSTPHEIEYTLLFHSEDMKTGLPDGVLFAITVLAFPLVALLAVLATRKKQ